MCSAWFSQQVATISLWSINRVLFFITEESVSFAIPAKPFNIIQFNAVFNRNVRILYIRKLFIEISFGKDILES
jgi:hypothetical protein